MSPTVFADLKPYLVVYDVPTRLRIAHPSGRLRSLGFRVNLSCWVMREQDIPYHYLNEIAGRGVRWKAVPFDATAAGELVAMGIENLKLDIRAAVDRARKAEKRISDARDSKEATDTDYAVACRANVCRLRKVLGELRRAAERFGIQDSEINAHTALTACNTLDGSMKAKCAAYANLAKESRKLKTREGDAMARAIESDAVPAGVAADFVEEKGDTDAGKAAHRVRGLFDF